MDLLDLFWLRSQDKRIDEIRSQLEHRDAEWARAGDVSEKLQELAQENAEVKLRLGLLLRLLITKGVFTAEEYANLLAESRPQP
jgi:hypothetical protein